MQTLMDSFTCFDLVVVLTPILDIPYEELYIETID